MVTGLIGTVLATALVATLAGVGAPGVRGVVGVVGVAGPSGPATAAGRYRAPVTGPLVVVRGFDHLASRYAAGHRGVDLLVAPGGAVVAAGAGTVTVGEEVGRSAAAAVGADVGSVAAAGRADDYPDGEREGGAVGSHGWTARTMEIGQHAIALVLTVTNSLAFSRCDKFSQASNLAGSALYSSNVAGNLASNMVGRFFTFGRS